MNAEEFGKMYMQKEADIENVIRGMGIYDEDLMHDTYIALYEYGEKAEIEDFVNVFVAFYQARYKRRGKKESPFIACDNATMVERFDCADESDLEYREQVMQRVDDIIDNFSKNPQPDEHHHERAVKVLQLYREGLKFREIAHELGIDVAAVHRHLRRAIRRIKSQQEKAII